MKPIPLVPLGCKVVIERLGGPERVGNILLVQEEKAKSRRGVIRAVGPGGMDGNGTHWDTSAVKVGDVVYFNGYAGMDTETRDGKTYLLIGVGDILAVEKD